MDNKHAITVRLTPDIHRAATAQATKEGRSLANWVTRLIVAATKGGK